MHVSRVVVSCVGGAGEYPGPKPRRRHPNDRLRRPPCGLAGRCQLKGMLDQALQAFFARLNQYTLADMVAAPTGEAIVRLVARSVPVTA